MVGWALVYRVAGRVTLRGLRLGRATALGTGYGARFALGAGVPAVVEQDDDWVGRREGERVQPRLAGVPDALGVSLAVGLGDLVDVVVDGSIQGFHLARSYGRHPRAEGGLEMLFGDAYPVQFEGDEGP